MRFAPETHDIPILAIDDPLFESLNTDGTNFSIMMVDIDHFKRVNDILGHDMGDQILKEVVALIVINMRAIDIVSRYGGEVS